MSGQFNSMLPHGTTGAAGMAFGDPTAAANAFHAQQLALMQANAGNNQSFGNPVYTGPAMPAPVPFGQATPAFAAANGHFGQNFQVSAAGPSGHAQGAQTVASLSLRNAQQQPVFQPVAGAELNYAAPPLVLVQAPPAAHGFGHFAPAPFGAHAPYGGLGAPAQPAMSGLGHDMGAAQPQAAPGHVVPGGMPAQHAPAQPGPSALRAPSPMVLDASEDSSPEDGADGETEDNRPVVLTRGAMRAMVTELVQQRKGSQASASQLRFPQIQAWTAARARTEDASVFLSDFNRAAALAGNDTQALIDFFRSHLDAQTRKTLDEVCDSHRARGQVVTWEFAKEQLMLFTGAKYKHTQRDARRDLVAG
ncbi:MAG: hypothetical protein ACK5QX_03035, partial [bacterium]